MGILSLLMSIKIPVDRKFSTSITYIPKKILNNMNWIKVNESLPEKGKDVLCMMRTDEGKTMPVIRWRSEYDDTVVDSNGFTIYKPTEVEVVAWMEIPKYKHSNSSKKSK